MKKLWIMLCAFSLFSSSMIFSQDEIKPDFSNRRTALIFTFSGLGNIGAGDFQGGIGGKLFFSPNLALRAGLSFVSASESIPYQNGPGQEGKQSATGFGINGAIEYHLSPARVSPYIGGGLSLNTLSTESKNAVSAIQQQTTVKNNLGGENIGGTAYQAGTTVSVFALVGAEFFLYKELSLAAEYRLGFSSTSQSDQEITTGSVTQKTTGGSLTKVGIDSQGFITLAFYF
ncbi:MAG: outer membrane beta-barrel protein [Bacteroidota bacterium]|nr:outer membrane beta-barrel protein [Bacteroidota bacterium]MDP4190456.1 outer membrane beta-barrel protein [Bacteroidota bacterium]